jgi:ribulose-5-phosphate 4-epimerase/fuculose-1-phosphate aldolase
MAPHTQFADAQLQEQVSEQEWQTRVDLAACYRLIAHFRWEDLIYTHITAKVPGTEEFLINPYGMLFDEITASSLIKVDLSGKKISQSPYETNPAGFLIHSAIHAVRHDVACIIHIHTADGIAVSVQKEGLLPLSQQSIFARASLAYHSFEGVVLDPSECGRLQQHLGSANFLILPNHGLLTCADTIPNTFLMMYTLQRACEIQVKAQSCGKEMIGVSTQAEAQSLALTSEVNRNGQPQDGSLAWPALLRRLDRLSPGYAA